MLIVGVPIAMPLIVLTFIAAFFPVIGSILMEPPPRWCALVGEWVIAP